MAHFSHYLRKEELQDYLHLKFGLVFVLKTGSHLGLESWLSSEEH